VSVQEEIDDYVAGQAPAKREDLQALHRLIVGTSPGCRLWFLDGRNEAGKVVSNPNIGYGARTLTYADGGTREFYRIGLSANTAGISLYVMGLEDKDYLASAYGQRLGKAKITGYCVKFRSIADLDVDVLKELIASRMTAAAAAGA
jgi:hypothetical protein